MKNVEKKIAIVGAGIIGLTTAYRLLQLDSKCYLDIYDKSLPGAGATSYAGAIDIPYFQSPFHKQLVQFSWEWFSKNIKNKSIRQARPITWKLPHGNTKADLQRHLLGKLGNCENNHITKEQEFEAESFVISPTQLCHFLLQKITTSGRANVYSNTTVLGINKNKEAPTINIATLNYKRHYDHIFICVGPWINNFDPEIEKICVDSELRTKKVCAFRFSLKSPVTFAIGDPINGIFSFPTNTHDEYAMSIKFDEYNVSPNHKQVMPTTVTELAKKFLTANFGEGNWTITKECIFVDTYTKSFTPLISTLKQYDHRVTLITGTHGSGIRLSPGLANEAIKQAMSNTLSKSMIA